MGCVESSYLAFEKLTGGAVTCPLTGCQTALSSGYSVLFGVPLSAYGAAAYGLVAALAWWGAGMADAVFDVEDAGDDASALASPERRSTADAYSKARALLCFSGFGLAGVSSYLLYVLAVPLGARSASTASPPPRFPSRSAPSAGPGSPPSKPRRRRRRRWRCTR